MCPKTKGINLKNPALHMLEVNFCQLLQNQINIISRYLCSDQNIYSRFKEFHIKASRTKKLSAAQRFPFPFEMEIWPPGQESNPCHHFLLSFGAGVRIAVVLVLRPTAGAPQQLIINGVCCVTQKLTWAVTKNTAGARTARLCPSAQSGAWFEAKASLCKGFLFFFPHPTVCWSLTLVQAADQGAAGHFCLWAPVVQSLSAPLQRRLWSWISHLLLRRHVQPAKKQQVEKKWKVQGWKT